MSRCPKSTLTRRELILAMFAGVIGCASRDGAVPADDEIKTGVQPLSAKHDYDDQRSKMVERQLRRRDISDSKVLAAMEKVPRHEFVPEDIRGQAYYDGALPIGNGQTISQPYIVALMTQLSGARPGSRALDVGTGSGYQAAVLAEIVDHVYSIEIVDELATQADQRLKAMGYKNIEVRSGDGYQGWPDEAPFDVIIVAAAPDHIPQPLVDQLAPGGRLVIPIGDYSQYLTVVEKKEDGSIEKKTVAAVAFVPMTGKARQQR